VFIAFIFICSYTIVIIKHTNKAINKCIDIVRLTVISAELQTLVTVIAAVILPVANPAFTDTASSGTSWTTDLISSAC